MGPNKFQVVITDCDHGSIEEEKEEMGRIGAELVLAQVREEEELIRACKEADGLLNQYALLTRRVFEHLPKCKVAARFGVGVDSIDLKTATDLGIIVANVPDYCIDEVSDHAIALILSLTRKTAFFNEKVKSGRWDFHSGIPIHRIRGKTLGLIGSGKIGLEVAKKLSSFGVRVIAFDPYLKTSLQGIELTNLDALLMESDFISIHCPLNDLTRHLIGEKEFQKMEKKPLIINTSRGPIIDERALIQALEKGLIAGAGLDVLEKEPPDSGNPMLTMENVILSPHVGFYSEESISELKRRTAKNVADVLTGRWPGSVVNQEVRGKTRAFISGD
ncbi:MAG: hydroxyacid dehydrogenase [Deltaproteobacteria bacterium RBG_16_49_23]|nr:MAG: hydroxyacid dehydrogenase [Deltaproteobacteria bacterium RBG_16_49_23]